MRTFATGATRDTVEGKPSYMRALSPAVLRRYVQYLAKHRKQADGNLRAFDNWKKGIPQDDYMDSLLRHTLDAWLVFNGERAGDGLIYSSNFESLQELLCAILFNTTGLLFELLVDEGNATRERTGGPGGPVADPARPLPAEAGGLKPLAATVTASDLPPLLPEAVEAMRTGSAKPRTCGECKAGETCNHSPSGEACSVFTPKGGA